ncbi:hypothetical protein ACNOYE_27070 [Nannocystaceae bacterium ST9]
MATRLPRAPLLASLVGAALLDLGCSEGSADESSTDASTDASTSEDEIDGSTSSDTLDADDDVGTDESSTEGESTSTDESSTDETGEPEPGPEAACVGEGAGGHLQFVASYWASTSFGDFIAELAPAIQIGHVDLDRLATPLPDDVDVIVDLHWVLFDYETHTVRADLDAQLDTVAAAVEPVLHRVRAFYLIDEPYVLVHQMPRAELEKAIAAVEDRFPDVPTYITFAHHCFDPASGDPACVVPSADRGIPAGLDWVGFDWYNDSNDLAVAATHVPTNIATGVDRIVELAPSAKVIVVPEAYTDGNRTEPTVVSTIHDYFVLAAEHPAVYGVDLFLWASTPESEPEGYEGLRVLPEARAAARGFGRWVRSECGTLADLVPVTQWYSAAGPDYRYEPWVWNGRAAGYRVDGVAFTLAPVGTPDTTPLVHCLIDRGDSVDSFLTIDPDCEGASLAAPSVVIGGIFGSEQPGTIELHRYSQQQAPWDHVYATSPNAVLPGDYAYEWSIGWVYPPSAL